MSKVLQEYKFLTEAETHRVKELDHAIEALEHEVDIINKFIGNTEKEWALLEAKLKKERLVALTALTKSKLLLAEMAVYIAENEPNHRCQKSPKIVKPNANEGNSQLTTSLVPSSRNPHRSSSTSCSPRHSSVRGSLTSLDCRSLSPPKSSNRGSSISKSCSNTRSSSQKSRKRSLFRKTDGNSPDRSGRSKSSSRNRKPSSRNDRKHCSFTQESMDENQQKSPSTKQQHRNGKENIPVVPLNNASGTSNNIDIIKSLTESITAELDKSSNKENLLALETSAKKQKINPVANIDAYKKHLSNNLHVSPTIPAAKIRPPLHPGDPRKYPTCDTKEGSISETLMRLPVPQFKVSRLVPAQVKQIEEIREECQHVPSQSEQVQIAPLNVQNMNFRHNSSNFIKQNHTENMDTSVYSIPTQTAIVREHGNTPQRDIDNSQTYLSQLSQYPQNIPQINSNNPQLTVDKRHICVPVPPMYNYSRNTGRSFSRTKIPEPNHSPSCTPETNLNFSYKQKYVPRVELSTKTKELRTPTGPTKVCFYNSS